MCRETLEFIAAGPGDRLDLSILQQLGNRMSRAQLQVLISSGEVLVDGRQLKAGARLRGGERVVLRLPRQDATEEVLPEDIALEVVHEDDHLAVIDKPAGMIVHPGDHNERGTLVAAALARWPELAAMPVAAKRAGIVHRLDKDTSGLIVLALRDGARRALMQQFQDRSVNKRYLALLERCPPAAGGRIDAPIGRDPRQRRRMAVVAGGRAALSEYRVLEADLQGGRALVEVRLHTGRTHQIRVHMAHVGCPIVADRVYGRRRQQLPLARQFLHAVGLGFVHPQTGAELDFSSPLPPDLQATLASLRHP